MNTQHQTFLLCCDRLTISEFTEYINQLAKVNKSINTYKKISYYNLSCAFDIETTSFISDYSEKVAIMYEWTLGINGRCVIGRTWNEFIELINEVSRIFNLSVDNRLVIYVHNLAYEFQFMRKYFDWYKVFSIDTRKPIYAVTTDGIEFRCSYLLSGYSLSKLGDKLIKYKVNKLDGFLNYDLLRHSKTELTKDEIDYCINDVLVVMAYIQERIETDGGIFQIPLTKTGYVRKYCKSKILGTGKKKDRDYIRLMKSLSIEENEYRQLKRAFQGGFTHANPFYSGMILKNVVSYDFNSSYPTVMLSEKFPMSKGELILVDSEFEFRRNIKLYCCLFDVEIIGLESINFFENYISYSRCWGVKNPTLNNGRIVRADKLYTTITEQDFLIIERFYSWTEFRVANFRRYKKAYLPTKFVLAIIELYQNKTQLKGVEGKEFEYSQSKEMLNSCYGMCVTDICRKEITYLDGEWGLEKANIEKSLSTYNRSFSRFLYYPWGVWVTAYARKNLFTGILEAGNDYVYSDTDSLKMLNGDNHIEYIDSYNSNIVDKLTAAMMWHGLEPDMITAKTFKGVYKTLGLWDYEGEYTRFKTLGAKRYMTEINGKYNLTVAGLSKSIAMNYIESKYKDPFMGFTNELYVPKNSTGKNIHTYIDEVREGYLIDYTGNISEYSELSGIHLEPADYSLSIGEEYARYLLSIQNREC